MKTSTVFVLPLALTLSLAVLPFRASAELPSGNYRISVTDATNRVWDVSHIAELQAPGVDFTDDDVSVGFDAPFVQTGAGKLTGDGATTLQVATTIFTGPVPGAYVAKGTITSAKGVARLGLVSSAKGVTLVDGRPTSIGATFGVKASFDAVNEIVTGTYSAAAAASRYGSVKESGEIDFTWNELQTALGNGQWTLSLALSNDGIKKVTGEALVRLSAGSTLSFTVKGIYNAKKDSTILILVPDLASKGSSLKVTLTGADAVALQGKLAGQVIKATSSAVRP